MQKTRPTFLGIGAQKAGTSWLHSQLTKHPEIWMPPMKELHFFDRSFQYPSISDLATPSPIARAIGSKPSEMPRTLACLKTILRHIRAGKLSGAMWWSKWAFGYYDENWYSSLFRQASSHEACGEITPSYSILEDEDVARIKKMNPDMNLLFMIRNPLERAWSAIRFYYDGGFVNIKLDSVDDIISVLKRPGMMLRGDYERTLNTYLNHFDSKQILVCFYEAIKSDPIGLMNDITTFLGVASFGERAIDNKNIVNASQPREIPMHVREYLLETYSPMVDKFAKIYGGYATMWDSIEDSCSMKSQRVDSPISLCPTFHP